MLQDSLRPLAGPLERAPWSDAFIGEMRTYGFLAQLGAPSPPCPQENESVDFLSVNQLMLTGLKSSRLPEVRFFAGFPTNEPPNSARNSFYLNKDYTSIGRKAYFKI